MSFPCDAATLYTTGFEAAEGYSTGLLSGQNGWFNSTIPALRNSVVFAGSQAATVTGNNPGSFFVAHAVSYNASGNPEQIVTLQTEFFMPSVPTRTISLGIGAYATGVDFIGQLTVTLNGFAQLSLASSTVGNQLLTPNTWNTLRLVLDFQNHSQSAYANSTLIGSGAFATPTASTLTFAIFGQSNGLGSTSDKADWDQCRRRPGT